jgi:hypothetical protein
MSSRDCWRLCGLGLAMAVWGGCWSGEPSRVYPPAFDPNAPQKALEMYDLKKDGAISGAELDKVPSLKSAFKGSSVTADAIAARIRQWKASNLGRITFGVRVLHNGQPLPDAAVLFKPEAFLGSGLPVCSGTTDRMGYARISAPTAPGDAPGTPPGFYRVEITKPGENIPAKYNTDTSLGEEISGDNEAIVGDGIHFDLKY